jgi:hypothetical protein
VRSKEYSPVARRLSSLSADVGVLFASFDSTLAFREALVGFRGVEGQGSG